MMKALGCHAELNDPAHPRWARVLCGDCVVLDFLPAGIIAETLASTYNIQGVPWWTL